MWNVSAVCGHVYGSITYHNAFQGLPSTCALQNNTHTHTHTHNAIIVVTGVRPINGPTTGAFVVTITGRNFGNHWNERMPFHGRVRFNQSICEPQQWISDSSLRCAVPGGQGRNVPVLIEIPTGQIRDKCSGEYIGCLMILAEHVKSQTFIPFCRCFT
jgi:hypothetical protein